MAGITDAFVTKLNPAGNALVYSTYLGGSVRDYGHGIAVDAAGPPTSRDIPIPPISPPSSPFRGHTGEDGRFRDQADAGRQRPGLLHLPGGKRYDEGYGSRWTARGRLCHRGDLFDQFPHPEAYQGTYGAD